MSQIPHAPRIRAIGTYVPKGREKNQARAEEFALPPGFLETKLGILERAVKAKTEATSDMCVQAFNDLCSRISLKREDIQLVCVVTQNPDRKIPHTSAIVHQKLGLSGGCMTFDVSQGCAGYVHALALVDAVMSRVGLEHALLFTCDPYSTIVDPANKDTALIFGDAATASLLSRGGEGYQFVDAVFGTLPDSADCLRCEGSLEMDGRAVLMNATREAPASIRALLKRNTLELSDIPLFLLHPGSKRVVDVIRRDLAVDDVRMPFEAGQVGNTVSSSIPLMLQERLKSREHARMLLCGFGVGFSWGSCLIEKCLEGEDP
jgi:3-oxoacyl-[acyl-carrier-protein] synthase-3